MRSISVIALLLGLSPPQVAQAQAFRQACHVDALCPGVERGGGKIFSCLREHKGQLSEQCFAAIGRVAINRNPGARNGPGAPAGDQEGPGGPGGPGDSDGPPPQQ